MSQPVVSLSLSRWCQATGMLLDLDAEVSGEPMRGDRGVGVPAGVEDLDIEWVALDGCPLRLAKRGYWFELTDAEAARAEEALLDRIADEAIAQWERHHA